MHRRLSLLVCACAALALAGCASGGPRRPGPPQWHPPVDMLLQYDANHDGMVTRAEMERGVHAAFTRADTNHDGHLDEDEVRAVNQQRWKEDASTASPLVDWNHDGDVDFNEFAATPRSLFAQLDADSDGTLSPVELKAGRAGPPTPKQEREHRPPGEPGSGPPGDDGDGDGD